MQRNASSLKTPWDTLTPDQNPPSDHTVANGQTRTKIIYTQKSEDKGSSEVCLSKELLNLIKYPLASLQICSRGKFPSVTNFAMNKQISKYSESNKLENSEIINAELSK